MTLVMVFPALAMDFTVYAGKVPPFTMVDDKGKVSGAAVDVVSEIMHMAGYPFDSDEIMSISWARAVEDTETNPGTMLFSVARTPQRENRFKWVGPIGEVNLGLVAKRTSKISIRNKDELKQYGIGVIRNSGPMQILLNSYGIPLENLTLLSSDLLQFRMLDQGRVDLITQADTAAPSWIRELGMRQQDFEMVHVMKRLSLYVAFNLSTDEVVIRRLQNALDELKIPQDNGMSRYDEIMSAYMADGPIPLKVR